MSGRHANKRPVKDMRNVNYLKPSRFADYMTISEVSYAVNRDGKWIIRLEKAGRIPEASRVQVADKSVRLWSPAQVEEMKSIFAQMKPGRPRKDGS